MKKQFIILLLFSGICLSSAAQTVIENPKIAGRNTQIVSITKIEMMPEETVFHITAKNSPKLWVKFASSTELQDCYSAKTYKLLRCEGYPLDTEYFMPEGQKDFKMYFEPLDSNITRVDFVEGYESGAFRVYGIEIRPDSRPYISAYNYKSMSQAGKQNAENAIKMLNNIKAINIIDNSEIGHYQVPGSINVKAAAGQTIVIPGEKLRKLEKDQNLIIQITER